LVRQKKTVSQCQMKHYKTRCVWVVNSLKCTKNAKADIERSQYADLIYQNKERIQNNYEIYRRRQAIVEHPYGVTKGNGTFIILWPRKPSNAPQRMLIDFTAYNLRRIFNLIDHKLLKQYLRILLLYFGTIRAIFNPFTDCFILIIIKRVLIERSLNVV
jgi:hypothetical protein